MSDTTAEVETKLGLGDVIPFETFSPKFQRAGKIIDNMDIPTEDKRDIFIYYLFSTSTKKNFKAIAEQYPQISERQFVSSKNRVFDDVELEENWNKFQEELQKPTQKNPGIR